ncbi:MAG TPA: hypothetical protein VNI83_09420 [Vicinamibacterales bacterium]|nr:hypothetical protein [Vicinamibacterales bacterium]
MYAAALLLHSWLRWLVLGAGLLAVGRALGGRAKGRAWGPHDDRAGRLFGLTLDIQMLLGLLLYFVLSPVVSAARADIGAAMRTSALRFWLVEHLVAMTLAVVLVHLGRARVRRALSDRQRFTRAAVYFGLALLLVLASIPWPGLPYARPLLRLP